MISGSFKNVIKKMCLQIVYLICMYENDFALNNQQGLICPKRKPNQIKKTFDLSKNKQTN